MGEQRLCKAKVAGSNPAISTETVVSVSKWSTLKFDKQFGNIKQVITALNKGFYDPAVKRRVVLCLELA